MSTPDWRELLRRCYVELFHCNQQMTQTLDENNEPMWHTGSIVRDILRDAHAALEAYPAASAQQADADAASEADEEGYSNEWNPLLECYERVRVHDVQKLIAEDDAASEADKADAARYRELRENHTRPNENGFLEIHFETARQCGAFRQVTDEEIDADVDEAIQRERQQGAGDE